MCGGVESIAIVQSDIADISVAAQVLVALCATAALPTINCVYREAQKNIKITKLCPKLGGLLFALNVLMEISKKVLTLKITKTHEMYEI